MSTEVLFWLILGGVLIIAELIVPGGVVVFLGLAALIIAGILSLGYSIGVLNSIFLWLVISIFFVLVIRRALSRFWPSDEKFDQTDFNETAKGKPARVTVEVTETNMEGRIFYAGTSWPARSVSGKIPIDEIAKILYRDNAGWKVEPTGKKITEDLWEI